MKNGFSKLKLNEHDKASLKEARILLKIFLNRKKKSYQNEQVNIKWCLVQLDDILTNFSETTREEIACLCPIIGKSWEALNEEPEELLYADNHIMKVLFRWENN